MERSRWARRVRWALGSLVAVGLLVVFGPIAVVWGVASGDSYTSVEATPPRDVTLVLGAGVLPSGSPSAFLQARLDLAADLYHAGRTKVLLVSGDNSEKNYDEPTAMRRYLHEHRGVPTEHIVLDHAGFDTYSSCVRAKRVFGVDQLTIITQGYHLPRAIAACELVGVDAQGLGDSSVRQRRDWNRGQWREVPACTKLLWDVATNRTPVLGPRENGVQQALAGR